MLDRLLQDLSQCLQIVRIDGADEIVESVYRIPFDDALADASADPARVRFYLGYAGWAAGQLDYELSRGSWHVLPGSADTVFADDPKLLWERLTPKREFRADAGS